MTGRPWTPRHDAILERQFGYVPTEQLAAQLHRSPGAIVQRAHKIGVTQGQHLTLGQVDAVLGKSGSSHRHQIRAWIDAGLLLASELSGRGWRRKVVRVRTEDLECFLRAHPHLVDRRDLDPAWRSHCEQWITAGEAFRRGAPGSTTLNRWVHYGWVTEARHRGRWLVIPERLLPGIIARRRTLMTDEEHRRQLSRAEGSAFRHRLERRPSRRQSKAS